MINNLAKLEAALNYRFKDMALLEEALTHPSLKQIDNTRRHYERFEFLGDSILGFLVTEMIFHRFNKYTEGTIAKIKAHVVSCEVIIEVATQIHLADYMIMSSGEENSGGRINRHNIENTMEALLGAIYLDSNIEDTRKIVHMLWAEHIENIDFSVADPKTFLQEWLHNKMQIMPVYKVSKQDGPVHAPIFTVQLWAGEESQLGLGHSIKEAEKDAARKMLKKLNG